MDPIKQRMNGSKKFYSQSPTELIASVMRRIYVRALITATGGNISMLEENGDIWISSKAVDEVSLSPKDIVYGHPDGTYDGIPRTLQRNLFYRATCHGCACDGVCRLRAALYDIHRRGE